MESHLLGRKVKVCRYFAEFCNASITNMHRYISMRWTVKVSIALSFWFPVLAIVRKLNCFNRSSSHIKFRGNSLC